MGGTALTEKFGFTGERMTLVQYHELVEELKQKESRTSELTLLAMSDIPAYGLKESHGDIDMVAVAHYCNVDMIIEGIKSKFGARYVSKNSYTYSFDFKGKYQVDLSIFDSLEDRDTYYRFCSYSPFGNVVGRLVKQKNLKYGVDGLTYPVKLSDSEQLGDIKLDVPFAKLIEFIGSDMPYGYFQKQEDIFRYLVGSKLFNKDIFQFENLNSVNKKRDMKRPDYHAWLEYIKDLPNTFVGNPDKTVYIDEIHDHFSVDIHQEWEALLGRHLVDKDISKKFNGELVRKITGSEGKELGTLIKTFKESIPNFRNYVLVHSADEIDIKFKRWLLDSAS